MTGSQQAVDEGAALSKSLEGCNLTCWEGQTSCVHCVVVGIEHRAAMHVDSGYSNCQLMHTSLPKDHPMRLEQSFHQGTASARPEACSFANVSESASFIAFKRPPQSSSEDDKRQGHLFDCKKIVHECPLQVASSDSVSWKW